MSRVRVAILLLALVAMAAAAGPVTPSIDDRALLRDSLRSVPPKQQADWLRRRGITIPGITEYRQQESTGLRLVGKYGRGRSWDVAGQDSLLFIALGSEIAVLSVANPAQPAIITELQLDYVPAQVVVRDSILVTGRNGIDLWSIADPTRPERHSHIPKVVSGYAVVDTFLYFVSGDTFNVYSIARPSEPVRLGSCRDSGYVVTATSRTAVLLTRDFLALVDVTNPSAPHRVGTYPGWPLAAEARDNLLCATFTNPSQPEQSRFATVDISNPASPVTLASLNSVSGAGLCLVGPYAFVCGRPPYDEPLSIVNIADSTNIIVTGELRLPASGYGWATWADLPRNRAYAAWDYCGTQVIDISSVSSPVLDTSLLLADQALDIWVVGNRASVAANRAGYRLLDVTDPAHPVELGGHDSIGVGVETNSVVADDSFAFIGWWPRPYFRVLSLADPSHPQQVASRTVATNPQDMVLRDTLVYAVGNQRFRVINVARPREPRLVGSCVLPGDVWDMALEDTLAYVTSTSLVVVNVARPSAPTIVGTWDSRVAVDVRDTIAFTIGRGAVWAMSAADPSQPYVLDTVSVPGWVSDIVLADTVAYAGGQQVYVVDIRDPRDLRIVGSWTPPHEYRRLLYSEPHLHAACYDAGVCIVEATLTGVAESYRGGWSTGRVLRLAPNPTAGKLRLMRNGVDRTARLRVVNVAGREVRAIVREAGDDAYEADVTGLASGVYFLEVKTRKDCARIKFVVQ